MRRQRQRGFTLLEVMIALAILAGGTVVLLQAAADNIRTANRAHKMGVATDLARAKMYDLEEELLQDGFSEMEKTEDGDFSDEGWPEYKWEVAIEKIELPGLAAAQQAATGDGTDGSESESAGIGGLPGMGGMGGTDPQSAMGAGLISSQYEMISSVLELAIRKITLKVTWQVRGVEESMTVVMYVTNPSAVKTAIQGGPPPGDDPPPDDDPGLR